MSKRSNMTPDEARNIIFSVYGARGQTKAAADIRRGEVTISRWLTGDTPIGATEALLLRLIYVLHLKNINWRKWLDDYEKATIAPPTLEDLI